MEPSDAPSPSLKRALAFLFAGGAAALIALTCIVFGVIPWSPSQIDDDAYGPPTPIFELVDFSVLPGWRDDTVAEAFPAFLQSCAKLSVKNETASANPLENLGPDYTGFSLAGLVTDWMPACRAAAALVLDAFDDDDDVRAFFEQHFDVIKVTAKRTALADGPARGKGARLQTDGVFTGYFEPHYEARREPTEKFSAALLTRPDDLLDVDLGRFRPELAGERIAGRITGNRLVPYYDHREINDGALNDKTNIIAWLEPTDLLFLQIQGSGQIIFDDGVVERVGYAGANGHAYTAIGRVLVQRGDMDLADVTMASIRQWLDDANHEQARALREENRSYVFFRKLDPPPPGFGPLGAQGAPLLPGRSLAVDRRFHAMGAPVYVDIEPVEEASAEPIRRLMIAQDTGGAIRGPVRGDFFWGAGEEAGARAGAMNAQGRMFVLLPKARAEALAAYGAAQ